MHDVFGWNLAARSGIYILYMYDRTWSRRWYITVCFSALSRDIRKALWRIQTWPIFHPLPFHSMNVYVWDVLCIAFANAFDANVSIEMNTQYFAHDNGNDDSNCTMRCGLSDCIPPIECQNELNNTITIIFSHNTYACTAQKERERETEGNFKIKRAWDFVTTKATHLSHFSHIHQSDRHKKYFYTHCTSVYFLWMSNFYDSDHWQCSY